VLERYAARAAELEADAVLAVATSAVRDAENGRAFLDDTVARHGFETRLLTGEGAHIDLDARGFRHTDAYGTVEEYSRVQPASYTDDQLARFTGTFVSDEAETTLTAVIENHALVLKRRPDTTIALTPLYMGAFNADHGLGTVVFRMDGSGRASELSVIQDRVWDLRFRKLEVRSQK